jgi:gluconolactonase
MFASIRQSAAMNLMNFRSPALAALLMSGPCVAQVVPVDATEFAKCVAADAKVEKLAGDLKFTEGPTWIGGADGFLVFSDIPANELKKWTAGAGLSVFRTPSNNTNGNTTDAAGRLLSAEHSARRVSHTQADGTVKTLVDSIDGKKFNSPNDLVVKSDGTVWFTDPPYGLPRGAAKEVEGHYVYRHNPKDGKTTVVSKEHDMPNGLAFSPDEKRLYVADSGRPHAIRAYDVLGFSRLKGEDEILSPGREFCVIDKGGPDGIRVDADGRVWSSAGDGVQVFSPDGKLVGRLLCPESPANLCFGGRDGKTLFMTARTGLYSVPVKVTAAARPKQ